MGHSRNEKQKILWAAGFWFFISFCTRKADVELPAYHPRLVLHGYTAVGEPFTVAIGKSLPPDFLAEDSATYIPFAWAVLFENGVFKDSLRYDATQKRYMTPL